MGVLWGFIQPIITVLVYWFVFENGLKAGKTPDNIPFFIWMITGMVPWFYFSEAISSGTSSLLEYGYLIKKIVFKVKLLPVVKLLSAIYVQLVFVAIYIIILLIYGYTPSLYWLQIFLYFSIMWFFILGIVLITSSLTPFFRDLPQIITIMLQVAFWITPIIWNKDILSNEYRWIVEYNPLFYIVEGYRDSFLYNTWIWERGYEIWVLIAITFFLNIIGIKLFSKSEVHFSDVL